MISRRYLYAMGETFGDSCTARREDGRVICGGGGKGGKSNSPTTTNTDRRSALQDATQVGDGATTGDISSTSYSTTYAADAQVLQTLAENMPDAVRAMASAGADVIKSAGGSIVDMNRDSVAANSKSFDSVVSLGAAAVDKLIDASTGLADKAIGAYQPPEKSNADALKWGLIAAVGIAAATLIGNQK